MTEILVVDPDGDVRFLSEEEAEQLGAAGKASYCEPDLDFGYDIEPHYHLHERWES
jgi:hypothetical protein